ncbi:uncharacterized protein B0P05DRAFT_525787 [Gilbertella persicaria]|uniref:uncharacterized protein n=1 Tax=Gilbertella persicaria TaxID=101096 RepID=UPI002220F473|nr:uncharacterized protein B0P05DRAFT_525787 [Gilbertella persicaria]KAI8092315.1 hypothetical protein B0P05DRAFT_525787 [Gilbertella persicaria]
MTTLSEYPEQTTLPTNTHIEEEGEEIVVVLENQDDQDHNTFYIQQEEQDNNNDEAFYLANKTFYTTCYKISRQNSPSYRKKPPYTFLENWLIHSVFSKSQQILLRFPVIHPKVMMTEGDFIYTPHQMATENNQMENNHDMYYQNNNYDYGDEEDYDYYDDAFVIGDEGVMMMSASAPDASQFMAEDEEEQEDKRSSVVMDENMWMGHSRYNTNGMTLHVVNPDTNPENNEDEEDPMYRNVTAGNPYKSNMVRHSQLQIVEEEDEEDGEDEDEEEAEKEAEEETPNVSLSPEILHWYRSADSRPITLNHTPMVVAKDTMDSTVENNLEGHKINGECSSSCSSISSTSSCSQHTDIQNTTHSDEKSIHNSSASYQSLADIIVGEDEQRAPVSYGTILPLSHNQDRSLSPTVHMRPMSPLVQLSECFVDAAWVALDLAQNYTESPADKKGLTSFVRCAFKIWKVLFLGAETMLSLKSHRMMRPQAVV